MQERNISDIILSEKDKNHCTCYNNYSYVQWYINEDKQFSILLAY